MRTLLCVILALWPAFGQTPAFGINDARHVHSALATGCDFKKDLASDRLLTNQAGYAVMAPLADRAIAQALAEKKSEK
jgi:hypothetical protein